MSLQIPGLNLIPAKNISISKPAKTSDITTQTQVKTTNINEPSSVDKNIKALALNFQILSPKERVWKETAEQALKLIEGLDTNKPINGNKNLAALSLNENSQTNKKMLDPSNKFHVLSINKLGAVLGGDSQEIVNPDNPKSKIIVKNGLSIEELNKGKNLEILKTTLNTMIEATNYKPTKLNMGNYNLVINNKELVQDLKPKYTSESFDKLLKKLEANHVFDVTVHPTLGIAKTAGTDANENFEMGGRYWITDSCHNIRLMKTRSPEVAEKVPAAIKTVARFFKENEKLIQNLINHPEIANLVKEGKFEEAKLQGIPHIFIPTETANGIKLTPDEDFNRWRQESHGNALKTMVTGIKEGLVDKKPYGLKPEDINNDIIDSIANLTTYFKAIDYPNVPSSGNWEETPFKNGLTSDTAVIVDALKATKDLMFNEKYNNNPEIIKVREKITNSPNGKLLKDVKAMDAIIKAGEDRIKATFDTEAPGYRAVDASQAFTVKMANFDDNPVESAKKALKVLAGIEEKLKGDYGIIRYEPTKVELPNGSIEHSSDGYLGANYCVAADKKGNIHLGYSNARDLFGAKDCSTPELFSARAKLCAGNKEELAQWFFDPSMSTAFNKVRKDLVQYKKEHGSTPEIDSMINYCFEKQTEFLNRGLGRITGKNNEGQPTAKANGVKAPEWAIPEAYMQVSTLKSGNPKNLQDKSKQGQFVPGLNTPLAWAQTEQLEACKAYEEALKEQK